MQNRLLRKIRPSTLFALHLAILKISLVNEHSHTDNKGDSPFQNTPEHLRMNSREILLPKDNRILGGIKDCSCWGLLSIPGTATKPASGFGINT